MATVQDTIEKLESQRRILVDNKRTNLRKGCVDCSCDSQIDAVSNRIEVLQFNNRDYTTAGTMGTVIPAQTPLTGSLTITLSNFEADGYTYLNAGLVGNKTFQVFMNTIANRYLSFEQDGFIRLPQGGFIFDPMKLELLSGQELIIII